MFQDFDLQKKSRIQSDVKKAFHNNKYKYNAAFNISSLIAVPYFSKCIFIKTAFSF